MKILKIELQNINSLKCDTPIIIDFELAQFQDVGLYAITGSTGAGKTTILDAITIALYHEVPRFKKSNIKAGLVDVVSYGAHDALSRVLFENAGQKYEATWSMRLATKAGKKLSTPKEEVRLKNISTGIIIAEKKRELQNEVERVLQLNYNQFLRSAMLAQGEFASFLSANAKDKGELLEQITGEDIYKKIGESINQKQYEEKKKLEAIQARINTEDLLSGEARTELKEEEKAIAHEVKQLAIELQKLQSIINWYKKEEELSAQQKELQIRAEKLNAEIERNTSHFNALALNEKAEVFKDIIGEITRSEQFIVLKNKDLLLTQEKLSNLKPLIEKKKDEEATHQKSVEDKKNNHQQWIPKLDKVAQLDGHILNKKELQLKAQNLLKKNELDKLSYEKEIKAFQVSIEDYNKEIQKLDLFIQEHKSLLEIEQHWPTWNTQFAKLRDHHQRTAIGSRQIANDKKEITENNEKLKAHQLASSKMKLELASIQAKYEGIEKQLKEKDLDKTLKLQELNTSDLNKWDKAFELSHQYAELSKNKLNFDTQMKETEKAIEKWMLLFEKNNLDLEKAKVQVLDQEKIIELEKSIKNLEEERSKLEEEKPCPLCGSHSHPFVEQYKELNISQSEEELKKRKTALEFCQSEKNKTEIELTKAKSSQTHLLELNQKNTENIDKIIVDSEQLELVFELGKQDFIQKKKEEIEIEKVRLKKEIDHYRIYQEEKVKIEKSLQDKMEAINTLHQQMASADGANKKLIEKLGEKETLLQQLLDETNILDSSLKEHIHNFQLDWPEINESEAFITNIQSQIAHYKKQEKSKESYSKQVDEIRIKHKNTSTQINKLKIELEEANKDLLGLEKEISAFTKERNELLPSETSVISKREELEKEQKHASKILEACQLEKQKLETDFTKNTTELQSIQKDVLEKTQALESLRSDFDQQLSQSQFQNMEEIKNALLAKETKEVFLKLKTEVESKSIEIKALEKKNSQDLESLVADKTFELPLEKAKIQDVSCQEQNEKYNKRLGEIIQTFKKDNDIKERNSGVFKEIETQEKQVKKWKDLMDLLGGSKHAFNTYVQRLTLKSLIGLANIHLYKLNKRYSLKMKENYSSGEELNFNLVDHYQTDEERYVDTSSGGEKFLISLALALGLSDLASSNVKIESLFIDEGFGTLDNVTLETVISTLETLQAQGKMIGIISHVENLKERIPTQIQLIKKSNGISEVEII